MNKTLKSLRLMKENKITKMKNNVFATFYQFKRSKRINVYENKFRYLQRVNISIL